MIRSESNNTPPSENARATGKRTTTRRILNVPLLVGTLVAAVVLGPAAYCWHSYQLRHTSGALLEEAGRLEQSEEFADAAGYLNRYLRLSPNDVEIRIRLAETFDKSAQDLGGKWRAKDLYYEALGVAPADRQHDLRCRLAELLLELGQHPELRTSFSLAETEANKLLKTNAGDPRARRLLALALDGQHRSGLLAGGSGVGTRIVMALENALFAAENRGHIELSAALAQLYRDHDRLPDYEFEAILDKADPVEQDSPDDALSGIRARIDRVDIENAPRGLLADDAIDEMVKANPKDPKALLVRYDYGRRHGLSRGEEDLAVLLKLDPDNVAVLLAAARHSREQAARAEETGLSAEQLSQHLSDAREHYERIISDLAPRSPEAHLGLGSIYWAQGQADQAITTWQSALDDFDPQQLDLNPGLLGGLANLSLRLADALIGQGRLNEAWVPPADLDTPEKRAQAAKAPMNRLGAAFDKVAHQLQGPTRLAISRAIRLAQAQWLVHNREYTEAIPLLNEIATGQQRTPEEAAQSYQACVFLSTAHAALGQWEQVARTWERAASLRPKLPQPRVQAAQAWARCGQRDSAIRQYRLALAVTDDPEIHFQLAGTLFTRQAGLPPEKRDWGLLENALEELKKPEFSDRLEQAWRVNLLEASYLLANDQEGAAGDGNATKPTPSVRAAKDLLDEALKDHPDSPDLLRPLVAAYERMEYTKDADRALTKLLELTPESATGYLLGSHVLCGREQYAEARKLVQDGIQKLPAEDQPRLQIRLAEISVIEGELQRARDELLALHEGSPSNVAFIWLLADLALQMNREGDLKGWEEKLLEAENPGGVAEEPDGVYWRYCRARRLLGESARAWKDATDTGKLAIVDKARTEVASVLGKAGTLCSDIQKRQPTWNRVHELRGRVFQQQAGLERTLKGRQLKHQQAIAAYQKAIDLGAKQIGVYEQVISLLSQLQRFAEADRYLARLKARGGSSQNLLQHEIAAAGRQGGLTQAIETARRGAEDRPDDANAQIWYGQVLAYDGQQEEAEAALTKAVALAPTDARTYSTLFAFYLRTRQRKQAENTLQELSTSGQLAPLELALTLAQAYEQLGDLRGAEVRYREAEKLAEKGDTSLKVAVKLRLTALLSRTDLTAAEKVLREILKLAPESDTARRGLIDLLTQRALALPAEESETLWREIQRLLGQSGSETDVSGSNQRLQAALWLRRGGDKNLQDARLLLEKLLEEAKGDSDIDRFYLARVYAVQSEPFRADAESYEELTAQGKMDQAGPKLEESHRRYLSLFELARQQYVTLVAQDTPDPSYLESYIDLLLRHKKALPKTSADEAARWRRKLQTIVTQGRQDTRLLDRYLALLRRHELDDEADRWLAELEEVSPDNLQVLALRVAWLHGLDRTAEAEPLVEAFADKLLSDIAESGDDRTQKEASIYATVGRLYSLVQQNEPAERWYRRLAELELVPKRYEPLALSVARQGRDAEAVRICLDAAQTDESSRPAMVAAAVLTAVEPTPESSQLAEPLLSRALANSPKDVDLLGAVANARIRQDRVDEAIGLYRRIVALEPKSAVALNNLATLLGEQPGGTKEALRFVEQAIRVAGPSPQLLDTKGTVLIYGGKAAQAIPVLEKAASSLQSDPRFPFHLAIAYYQNGRNIKAKETLARALDGNLLKQILTEKDRELLSEMEKTLR